MNMVHRFIARAALLIGLLSAVTQPLMAQVVVTVSPASIVRDRLVAARERAQARNPRLTPVATNSAGTYTLLDGSTVTVSSTATYPSGSTTYPLAAAGSRVLADYDALFSTEGGYRSVATGGLMLQVPNARTVAGVSWDATASKQRNSYRFSVESNAPTVFFQLGWLGSGTRTDYKGRVLVNGQYVDLAGHTLNDYVQIAFGDSRTRTITLELQNAWTIQGFLIQQGANYYAVNRPADRKPRILFIADSYGVGPSVGAGLSDTTQSAYYDNMYSVAADWLGAEGIVSAIGGTGFTTNNGGNTNTYPQRWQDVLDINAQQPIDALHVHGSVNDALGSASVADIQTAATAYLIQAVRALPNIPITVSGCFQLAGSANPKAVQIEAALSSAVAAAVAQTGSTRLKFIAIQSPPYVPTWPTTPPSSLILADGSHPTPGPGGGHASFGKRMASDLYRAWISMQ